MDKHLHIISFDVPWPADYGGVVEVFHKLVALHKLGVKIHLHCFSSTRPPQDELDKYCFSVNYYPRNKLGPSLSLRFPYIVSSRKNKALLHNLCQDDYPILMEGIHCTYLLQAGALAGRRVFVRLHNVEFNYYAKLAAHEKNFAKRAYYLMESFLLKGYEKSIANKAIFFAVSADDKHFYEAKFNAKQIYFLPAFVGWSLVNSQMLKGCFCLYQGNLSVNENVRAVEWLLKEVFNDISIPFVIAGKNPSPQLEQLVYKSKSCCLVSNPSEPEMQDLIKKAQINILPSFNNTGVKLKLLNALYHGKYCLVNTAATAGAGIESLCEIADSAEGFKSAIQQLYEQPYPPGKTDERGKLLGAFYNNDKNAQQIIDWIY